jgi:hypothetical protein
VERSVCVEYAWVEHVGVWCGKRWCWKEVARDGCVGIESVGMGRIWLGCVGIPMVEVGCVGVQSVVGGSVCVDYAWVEQVGLWCGER